jgi:N-methylhydantoinase A
VLCALGLAAAAPRRDVSRTVMLGGESLSSERLHRERAALLAEASAALGAPPSRVRVRHELRYRGQSFELPVDDSGSSTPATLREAFAAAHEQRYGYRDDSADVELVTVRVSVWGEPPALQPRSPGEGRHTRGERRLLVLDGEASEAEVLRGELAPGTRLEGPALCAMPEATLFVAPGWAGEVDASGSARLQRIAR